MANNSIKVHVNDVGTIIKATLKKDGVALPITNAVLMQFIIVNATGVKVIKTANFSTDGSDGNIEYITVDGDLSVPGEYYIQAEIHMPGWKGKSNINTFEVTANL